MRGKVEGLCGDYDSNTENDFVTPDGNTVENAMEFVKSWKVLGYHAKKLVSSSLVYFYVAGAIIYIQAD